MTAGSKPSSLQFQINFESLVALLFDRCLKVFSITTVDASPTKIPYVLLHDQHNDLTFHVDTANPRLSVPFSFFMIFIIV